MTDWELDYLTAPERARLWVTLTLTLDVGDLHHVLGGDDQGQADRLLNRIQDAGLHFDWARLTDADGVVDWILR